MVTRVPTAGITRDAKSITTNLCSGFSETIRAAAGPNGVGAGPAFKLPCPGVVLSRQPVNSTAAAKPTVAMRLNARDGNGRLIIIIYMTFTREIGAPGVTRTRDRRIRNPMLYPTELQAQSFILLVLTMIALAVFLCCNVLLQ